MKGAAFEIPLSPTKEKKQLSAKQRDTFAMKQLEREQEIRRKRYQREEQKRMEVRRRAAEVRELKIEAIRRKAEAKSVKAIASTKTTSPRDSPVAKKSPVKVLKSAPVSVASKRSLKKVIKNGRQQGKQTWKSKLFSGVFNENVIQIKLQEELKNESKQQESERRKIILENHKAKKGTPSPKAKSPSAKASINKVIKRCSFLAAMFRVSQRKISTQRY